MQLGAVGVENILACDRKIFIPGSLAEGLSGVVYFLDGFDIGYGDFIRAEADDGACHDTLHVSNFYHRRLVLWQYVPYF